MRLYVKAVDEVLGDETWLRIENGEVEAIEDFEPDPFSKVVNVLEGQTVEIGIYRYKIVGDIAYTRRGY